MSETVAAAVLPAVAQPGGSTHTLSVAQLEETLAQSTTFAWCLLAGLPTLGFVASVFAGLPLFAALMAACFLLGATLTGFKAIATFTGKTLRLLVAARLIIVVVVGSLLFVVSGSAWHGIVSAVLLWLAADRLLGRRALYDLWKLTRKSPTRG